MSAAARVNLGSVLLLLMLQLAWHGMLRWTGGNTGLLVVLGVPLAGVLLLHLARRRSARFWSGVVALLTFCHGITEAWTLAGARVPGLAEAALSALAVTSASWDGLKARRARKAAVPPPV